MSNTDFTQQEWEACLKVLKILSKNPNASPDTDLFKGLVTKIHKQARKEIRKNNKTKLVEEDKQVFSSTETVKNFHQKTPPFSDLSKRKLNKSVNCYVCKKRFDEVHFFYHRLCPACADFNYSKREQCLEMKDRIVLITGGRIKVGYQTALKFLRDGARVIVTTRFPVNALAEYSKEPDYQEWQDKLSIYGLDLRNIFALENFINYLKQTELYLDIIVNNAAQTIKYPNEYYQPLLERENELNLLPATQQEKIIKKVETEIISTNGQELAKSFAEYFPPDKVDIFNQPLDLRPHNSWVMKLDEVEMPELIEVNLINNIAPFILNSKLKDLLCRSPFEKRFVINVTSSEGQFSYHGKTVHHPHTNMTKAALNMMTRTSAEDYAESNIFMNSVDVGWMSSGKPFERLNQLYEEGFTPPLDLIDGAARIYDCIGQTLNNEKFYGKLLKDYCEADW
ncbi:MAG: SDR family oxidoreductase [Pyrinomonadaceae bacterium]|nr:SDR family oxidoreductase [Pyrinomonadaceae bacterium]